MLRKVPDRQGGFTSTPRGGALSPDFAGGFWTPSWRGFRVPGGGPFLVPGTGGARTRREGRRAPARGVDVKPPSRGGLARPPGPRSGIPGPRGPAGQGSPAPGEGSWDLRSRVSGGGPPGRQVREPRTGPGTRVQAPPPGAGRSREGCFTSTPRGGAPRRDPEGLLAQEASSRAPAAQLR